MVFPVYTKVPFHSGSEAFRGRISLSGTVPGEFSSGPVVRTWHFHCQRTSSVPGWEIHILQAAQHGQKPTKQKPELLSIREFRSSKDQLIQVSSNRWGHRNSNGLTTNTDLRGGLPWPWMTKEVMMVPLPPGNYWLYFLNDWSSINIGPALQPVGARCPSSQHSYLIRLPPLKLGGHVHQSCSRPSVSFLYP